MDGAILLVRKVTTVRFLKRGTFLFCVLFSVGCGPGYHSERSMPRLVNGYRNPYFEQGNIHLQRKAYYKAIEQYQQALRLEPESAIIHAALAWAYYNVGMLDPAITEAEEVSRLRPDDPDLPKILEMLYQQRR